MYAFGYLEKADQAKYALKYTENLKKPNLIDRTLNKD